MCAAYPALTPTDTAMLEQPFWPRRYFNFPGGATQITQRTICLSHQGCSATRANLLRTMVANLTVQDDKPPLVSIVPDPNTPLARGAGAFGLPRGERLYYWFGDPIDTAQWAGRSEDASALRECRDATRDALTGRSRSLTWGEQSEGLL